jgi:hypothetical protein
MLTGLWWDVDGYLLGVCLAVDHNPNNNTKNIGMAAVAQFGS